MQRAHPVCHFFNSFFFAKVRDHRALPAQLILHVASPYFSCTLFAQGSIVA